jgi:hypothetical protein
MTFRYRLPRAPRRSAPPAVSSTVRRPCDVPRPPAVAPDGRTRRRMVWMPNPRATCDLDLPPGRHRGAAPPGKPVHPPVFRPRRAAAGAGPCAEAHVPCRALPPLPRATCVEPSAVTGHRGGPLLSEVARASHRRAAVVQPVEPPGQARASRLARPTDPSGGAVTRRRARHTEVCRARRGGSRRQSCDPGASAAAAPGPKSACCNRLVAGPSGDGCGGPRPSGRRSALRGLDRLRRRLSAPSVLAWGPAVSEEPPGRHLRTVGSARPGDLMQSSRGLRPGRPPRTPPA